MGNLPHEKRQSRVVRNLRIAHAQHHMTHCYQGVLPFVVIGGLLGILNRMVIITVILHGKAYPIPRKIDLHAILTRKVTPPWVNDYRMVKRWPRQAKATKINIERQHERQRRLHGRRRAVKTQLDSPSRPHHAGRGGKNADKRAHLISRGERRIPKGHLVTRRDGWPISPSELGDRSRKAYKTPDVIPRHKVCCGEVLLRQAERRAHHSLCLHLCAGALL